MINNGYFLLQWKAWQLQTIFSFSTFIMQFFLPCSHKSRVSTMTFTQFIVYLRGTRLNQPRFPLKDLQSTNNYVRNWSCPLILSTSIKIWKCLSSICSAVKEDWLICPQVTSAQLTIVTSLSTVKLADIFMVVIFQTKNRDQPKSKSRGQAF